MTSTRRSSNQSIILLFLIIWISSRGGRYEVDFGSYLEKTTAPFIMKISKLPTCSKKSTTVRYECPLCHIDRHWKQFLLTYLHRDRSRDFSIRHKMPNQMSYTHLEILRHFQNCWTLGKISKKCLFQIRYRCCHMQSPSQLVSLTQKIPRLLDDRSFHVAIQKYLISPPHVFSVTLNFDNFHLVLSSTLPTYITRDLNLY